MGFVLPESNWRRPAELPDLRATGARRVALDTETRDDGLRADVGSGWPMRRGYVAGVSVAWEGGSVYAPLAHPATDNFDREAVRAWLGSFIHDVEVVTQNGPYDYGWLMVDGLIDRVPARIQDTMFAAYMIDENRLQYDLDSLCAWQGILGKDNTMLIEAGHTLGLGKTSRQVYANLWRMPAQFVGPYAEADAAATLALWGKLCPLLAGQGLERAYGLEMELLPCCLEMRRRGVRIDTARADETAALFRTKRDEALTELSDHVMIGRRVTIDDVRSARWLEGVHDAAGLSYARTEKSAQGRFQSKPMAKSEHPIPRLVATARVYEEAASKFCEGFLLNFAHRGRLHPEIHQVRDEDEGGTRSYRFSYSDPPLQQMPSPKRNREIGLAVRALFLPEEGEEWISPDYSQQEYRLMVNDAVLTHLPGAAEAAQRYRDDPETDFHQLVADLTGLERKPAKDCNFAKIYGAGAKKFAVMIGRSVEEAEALMAKYDEMLPFPRMLAEKAKATAARRGYVRLLDDARCRFDLWEPGWGYEGPYHRAVPEATARAQAAPGSGHDWAGARLRRAFTHKAMNRRVQGSAARQTKMAMRDLWREGIVPLLQMHDEINCSGDESRARRVGEIMVNTVQLEVPMQVDVGIGPNWAELRRIA